jgi:hypothetical protein
MNLELKKNAMGNINDLCIKIADIKYNAPVCLFLNFDRAIRRIAAAKPARNVLTP